jgi:hypothetical protein
VRVGALQHLLSSLCLFAFVSVCTPHEECTGVTMLQLVDLPRLGSSCIRILCTISGLVAHQRVPPPPTHTHTQTNDTKCVFCSNNDLLEGSVITLLTLISPPLCFYLSFLLLDNLNSNVFLCCWCPGQCVDVDGQLLIPLATIRHRHTLNAVHSPLPLLPKGVEQ